jgi:hypothetical protein
MVASVNKYREFNHFQVNYVEFVMGLLDKLVRHY